MWIRAAKLSFTPEMFLYIHGWTRLWLSHVIHAKSIALWINVSATMTPERNFSELRAKCQRLWPLPCLLHRFIKTPFFFFFFSSSRPGFNKWSSDKKIHSQLGNTFRHLSSWEWNLKARWNHKSSARWILATNGCIPPAGRREFIRDEQDFF